MRIEMRTAFAMWVMWAATIAHAANSGPEVLVSGGKIHGVLASYGGAVFKGIPFAQPPTGELRWREPMPVKTWTGERDTTAFAAPCMQGGAGGVNSSEDCLYLNILTPDWPAESGKSGNGLVSPGEGTSPAPGRIRPLMVKVTAQYQLGVFGFLGHPDLTKESAHHVSGNYGLFDQIAVLRWVRDCSIDVARALAPWQRGDAAAANSATRSSTLNSVA